MLHIHISLVQNFSSILVFWTKFAQKRYFQLKTEQAVQGLLAFTFCVVNVNSTVAFTHFEELKDLVILNILKEMGFLTSRALFTLKLYKAFQTTVQIAMISKVMIKFWSKFQFQIPLQFYRTVEMLETCDGNGQKF